MAAYARYQDGEAEASDGQSRATGGEAGTASAAVSPGAVSPRLAEAVSPRSAPTPTGQEAMTPTVLAGDTPDETLPADRQEMDTDEGSGQAEALQPPAQRRRGGQGWS